MKKISFALTAAFLTACAAEIPPPHPDPLCTGEECDHGPACEVSALEVSELGFRQESPDGSQFLLNIEDENGVAQVYLGDTASGEYTCLTCEKKDGGPEVDRFKMQPHFHPTAPWVIMAVERDAYETPIFVDKESDLTEGWLQCGLWTDMWAMSIDGERWHRLTNFASGQPGVPDGYTGPAISPDGTTFVYSQIVDGNTFAYYPFGRWELIKAEFAIVDGVPTLQNLEDITPEGMHWNEPGNFAPDNQTVVITGSTEDDAHGQDQYTINVVTGEVVNLTNSPEVWDEHGMFSPDGEKILFMSAAPYRNDPSSSTITAIRTDFLMMNKDGSGVVQLTDFCADGCADEGIAGVGQWSRDGKRISLRNLVFPNYIDRDLEFAGACGMNPDAGDNASE